MNRYAEQVVNIYKSMPLSRKIMMGAVVAVVIIGLAAIILFSGKTEYLPLYTDIEPEKASKIVDQLKEMEQEYKLGKDGVIMVPADKVYDIRLSVAGTGILKGGTVGYEIFDKTDFGATEFVQKLNFQRALQGELSRTIKSMEEVQDARVMIVLGRDSVFIEESKMPSASVMLKLDNKLPKKKVEAIVNLVASSVEDLTPDRVTVTDTLGNVLSKGLSEEEELNETVTKQLEYRMIYEKNLGKRIQNMLESIVGMGNAMVTVSAEMDFNQENVDIELFDPNEQGEIMRSRQNIVESVDSKNNPYREVSDTNPILPPPGLSYDGENYEKSQKQNEIVNYEISKTIRRIKKPVGTVTRLSVSAVVDDKLVLKKDENGKVVFDIDGKPLKEYVKRSPEEMAQFENVVKNAMGYLEDRGDQVSVESFTFSSENKFLVKPDFNWKTFIKENRNMLAYVLLIMLLFLFIVRPVVKALRDVYEPEQVEKILMPPEEQVYYEEVEEKTKEEIEKEEVKKAQNMLTDKRARAKKHAEQNVDKTASIVISWLNEEE